MCGAFPHPERADAAYWLILWKRATRNVLRPSEIKTKLKECGENHANVRSQP